MKKYILTLLLLLEPVLFLSAQSLSVESFKLLENDMTANTKGTLEYDQNGDAAALIKIITTETGFVVDGGMMGIVKTKQEVAELWVYVPYGIQKIKLRHPQLGQLEYYFPIAIDKARTYEMRLVSGTVRTIVDDQHTMQYLIMKVNPANASVFIDEKLYSLESDGTLAALLTYGNHTYRVQAASCVTEAGTVRIGKEKTEMEVKLKSARAELTLECPMEDADIYLNEKYVGTGHWTGFADAGNYIAEVRKEGYRSRSMSIVLAEQDTKAFTLPVPQPMYGSIQVSSKPSGASVLVDGEVQYGETPLYLTEILAKDHQIIIRKEGYQDYVDTISVKENERSFVNAEMSNIINMVINSKPGAILALNGKSLGMTPYSETVPAGKYHVVLIAQGYEPFQDSVMVSVEKPTLNIRLYKKCFTTHDKYVNMEFQTGSVSAFDVMGGLYVAGVNLEAGLGYAMSQPQTIFWNTRADNSSISEPKEYKYKPMLLLGGRVGYGIRLGTQVRFTPQIGLSVMHIKGECVDGTPQKTYVAQGVGDVKIEFSPGRPLTVTLIPEYAVPLKKGRTAEMTGDVSPDISRWFGGFGIKAGFGYYF